jgi:hypothetical protein
MRLFLLIISLFLLSGCATKYWAHRSAEKNNNSVLQREKMQCEMYARGTTPMPRPGAKTYTTDCDVYGYSASCTTSSYNDEYAEAGAEFGNAIVRGIKQARCMRSLGWFYGTMAELRELGLVR